MSKSANQVVSMQRVSDADIFGAVKRCIDTQGGSKFTMADVAKAAGLTRVQIYNRFGSRDALVLAFLVDHVQEFKARASAYLLEADDLIQAIIDCFLMALHEIENDTYFRMLLMPTVVGQNHLEGTPQAILELGKKQWKPAIERGISEGILNTRQSIDKMAEWLTFNEMTLLNAVQTYSKTLDDCETTIRAFILPPILSNPEE